MLLQFTCADGRHVLADSNDVRRVELHPRKPIATVHTYDGERYEVHGPQAVTLAETFVGGFEGEGAGTPLPPAAPPSDGPSPPAREYLAVEGPPGVVEPLASALLGTEVRSVEEGDISEGAVVVDGYDADVG